MNGLKFSVVIPYRRREDNIRMVFESLAEQTMDRSWFEVIVGAIEYSGEFIRICQEFTGRLTIITVMSAGEWNVCRARNLAIRQASGEVIVILDADMAIPPALLDRLSDEFYTQGREICVLGRAAGDGTKLKANAAMAANLTQEQLDAQIAELEAQIDAEFRGWAQDMLDGEDLAPAPVGDGPGDGDGSGTAAGGTKEPKRPELVLQRRKAARAQLAARQDAQGRQEQEELQARTAQLAARVEKKEAAVTRWERKAAARIGERARRDAAGERIPGTRPVRDIGQDREVKRARQARDKARADHEAACQAAAASAASPGAKVNATDPSSRVMPLKKGGFDQLFNVQALATAKTQVILAIMRHPSPVDVQALLPLLAEARRVLRAAGITDEILTALFDAGYASDASFTADIPEKLCIAVTREARQTGRSQDGRAPQTMLPSWENMTARLDTDEGKKLYRQRAATIEPVFAQLTARLGRTLHYRGDAVDAELALWGASHNILKAITARIRRLTRQARAAAATAAIPAAA